MTSPKTLLRRSVFVALAAIGISGTLHAAALMLMVLDQPALDAGGEAEAPPLLGDSFADMAEGTSVPVAPEPVETPPVAAETVQPVAPALQAAALPHVEALAPLKPEALPEQPPEAVLPLTAEPAQPVERAEAVAAAPVAEALQPVEEPADLAEAPSTRPRARPATRPERQAETRPDPQPQAERRPAPAGNAQQSAQRGSAQGRESGRSQAAAAAQPAPGDGGSARAAASYGRDVMRKISRTRKKRSSERGRAVVSFVIADSGALGRVSIVQSSGSANLDAQALDHIRRAAPFPPPPAGAPRSLSVEFVGR